MKKLLLSFNNLQTRTKEKSKNSFFLLPTWVEGSSELFWSKLSVVLLRRRRRCCRCGRKLFTFSFFFFRTNMPISTKLGTKYPWVKGIQDCSNEWLRSFSEGDNYEIAKIHWQYLNYLKDHRPKWSPDY